MNLSIVIPVYNGQDKVVKCLDSIFSQKLPENDVEIICVDDFSSNPLSVKTLLSYEYGGITPPIW